MIIRKKNIPNKKSSSSSQSPKKGSVIKKEDVILDVESTRNTNENKESILPSKLPEQKIDETESFEKIDISLIEFKERVERRRGDRRRGYRRIDERSLVSRAQQEAHTIKELAAREGYKNGFSEAQEQLEEIKKNLAGFFEMKDAMYDEFYPHIMEIAFAIAKRIIKKETQMSDDILKNIFSEVLDGINSDAQRLEVKVNSQDVEFANASLPEILENRKLNVRIIVTPDDTIEKGSCAIIANNGVIDANFKTQLAVLQNAFGIYKGGL
jgi:flagellar assembly protein FliH